MPEFSKDWSLTRLHWPELLAPWTTAKDVLEIGCYEGQSTLTLLELMPEARLTVIDPFYFDGQLARFTANVATQIQRVDVQVGPSIHLLSVLLAESLAADMIYIDGSHRTADVLADAVLAWPLLRPGGLMLFDDYDWPAHPDGEDVGKAVDAFLDCYGLRGWQPLGSDQYAIVRPE